MKRTKWKSSIEKDMNLILRLAWSFNRTTGIDFEDLRSEGCLAYLKAERNFNPSYNVKKTTYVYIRIKRHLIDYCKKERKHRINRQDVFTYDFGYDYQNDLKDRIEDELDDHSKKIIVFAQIVDNLFDDTPLLQDLYYLLRQNGWYYCDIKKSIKKIKKFVNFLQSERIIVQKVENYDE